MKKFTVVWLLHGPGGRVPGPAVGNPLGAESLADLLQRLSCEMPPTLEALGVSLIGVKIEEVKDA